MTEAIEIGQLILLLFITILIVHYGDKLPKKRKAAPRKPRTIQEAKENTPPRYRARANSNTELYDREKFGD